MAASVRHGTAGTARGEARGQAREHGGALDRARRRFGGAPGDWVDLSTGINPRAFPLPALEARDWCALPDIDAHEALVDAARHFWNVPAEAGILPAPGASALIARIPLLAPPGKVQIRRRSYNEHAAAFAHAGWEVVESASSGDVRPAARVVVNPDNPDGRLWDGWPDDDGTLLVIDESFCDTTPTHSHVALAARPDTVVLKSFGKFWGLAGLRLGFAIGRPGPLARLGEMLGPWPVSGPALKVGAAALSDTGWANDTRAWLDAQARRLDGVLAAHGARPVGGTSLFRLYDVGDAARWHAALGRGRVLGRVFSHTAAWLRLGIPGSDRAWAQLETALAGLG